MPISENDHNGPEDLGYESSYEELRPEGERAMARRMREGMDQAGIDPEIADALGAPSPSDMRQALQWGVGSSTHPHLRGNRHERRCLSPPCFRASISLAGSVRSAMLRTIPSGEATV